ncbi:hypothetical protein B5F77_00625 [Parabacteroides sp. An277]|uniref:hypothetical protein n=1 Tax=Parabacteroides sp. An277 TaxID=1965619 RepID=UPI000B368825|nr:hypothetical protein [Parabacteroides sp. An277]OUO55747.1 hypothetical protein B5F77_00625 [Parabacteroides sp. An277]
MDTKIQELTDKIYKEGVEKGNEEAARIIADAESRQKALLAEAEAKAQEIVAAAEKKAAELKKNTEAELRLFAAQSVEALKSEVANLITGKVVSDNVKAVLTDAAFMQKVILALVKGWQEAGGLIIQTADAEALRSYFLSNAKSYLDKGLKIEQVNGKKTSFAILPADGSYKVSFGEEEFVEFFKEFLRPQLVEALF